MRLATRLRVVRAHQVGDPRVQRFKAVGGARNISRAHQPVGLREFLQPVEVRLLALGDELVEPDVLLPPPNLHPVDLSRARQLVLRLLVSVLAHQYVRAVGLVEGFDARGKVHGIAGDRIA